MRCDTCWKWKEKRKENTNEKWKKERKIICWLIYNLFLFQSSLGCSFHCFSYCFFFVCSWLWPFVGRSFVRPLFSPSWSVNRMEKYEREVKRKKTRAAEQFRVQNNNNSSNNQQASEASRESSWEAEKCHRYFIKFSSEIMFSCFYFAFKWFDDVKWVFICSRFRFIFFLIIIIITQQPAAFSSLFGLLLFGLWVWRW